MRALRRAIAARATLDCALRALLNAQHEIRASVRGLDVYDGVRTGIADLNGAPHYLASQFDEDADDYSDNFKLYPVDAEFMERAMRNWAIYRAWERRFHSGEAKLETHPGHGGIDPEYDELKTWLDGKVGQLQALPTLYKAKFRELHGQEALPGAMLREIEVEWSPSSG